MASPRIKRLKSDHKKVLSRFQTSKIIDVRTVGNTDPPNKYQVTYKINGQETEDQVRKTHEIELFLDLDYPKKGPKARMRTPIYHPNINTTRICYGDHWTPQETLDALIIRIGEMIAYQSYYTKSPLNGEAARWTEMNPDRFPLDKRDLFPSVSNPPVIKLNGSELITMKPGSDYFDKGATAYDEVDGDLTSSIVTSGTNFDNCVPGTYTIRYNVKNRAGTNAQEVIRKVSIEEPLDIKISIKSEDLEAPKVKKEKTKKEANTQKSTKQKLPLLIHVWSANENWEGPYTLSVLQTMLDQGQVTKENYAFFEGGHEGSRIFDVPGIEIQIDKPTGDNSNKEILQIQQEILELKNDFNERLQVLEEKVSRLLKQNIPNVLTPESIEKIKNYFGGREKTISLNKNDGNPSYTITAGELANGINSGDILMNYWLYYDAETDWVSVKDFLSSLNIMPS